MTCELKPESLKQRQLAGADATSLKDDMNPKIVQGSSNSSN